MGASSRVRVILEVERSTEPIAGVVATDDGVPHSFCGWTALANAIAAVLDEGSSSEELVPRG